MPTPVEGLLEVYEDVVEALVVLEIFLRENEWVEDLLCGASTFYEVCLFSSDDLLRLWLQSVQYDLQHAFAWVADGADLSVVPALLQVAFLGKCEDKGPGPWGWPFSCLSNVVADCRDSGDYILSTCFADELMALQVRKKT